MSEGLDQPPDPPTSCSFLNTIWREREFTLKGEIVVKASVFPSAFKKLIQEGLKTKVLTWDILSSDNFLQLACHSKVPVHALLKIVRETLLPSAIKPDMCALIERMSEDFWRLRDLPNESLFDPAVARLLYRHDITLPMIGREHNHSELRLYSHALPSDDTECTPCDCFHCLIEPHLEAKIEELWEKFRIENTQSDGTKIIAWTQWVQHRDAIFNAYLWGIDTTEAGELEKWSYRPDEPLVEVADCNVEVENECEDAVIGCETEGVETKTEAVAKDESLDLLTTSEKPNYLRHDEVDTICHMLLESYLSEIPLSEAECEWIQITASLTRFLVIPNLDEELKLRAAAERALSVPGSDESGGRLENDVADNSSQGVTFGEPTTSAEEPPSQSAQSSAHTRSNMSPNETAPGEEAAEVPVLEEPTTANTIETDAEESIAKPEPTQSTGLLVGDLPESSTRADGDEAYSAGALLADAVEVKDPLAEQRFELPPALPYSETTSVETTTPGPSTLRQASSSLFCGLHNSISVTQQEALVATSREDIQLHPHRHLFSPIALECVSPPAQQQSDKTDDKVDDVDVFGLMSVHCPGVKPLFVGLTSAVKKGSGENDSGQQTPPTHLVEEERQTTEESSVNSKTLVYPRDEVTDSCSADTTQITIPRVAVPAQNSEVVEVVKSLVQAVCSQLSPPPDTQSTVTVTVIPITTTPPHATLQSIWFTSEHLMIECCIDAVMSIVVFETLLRGVHDLATSWSEDGMSVLTVATLD
eukprot:gene29298-36323_t